MRKLLFTLILCFTTHQLISQEIILKGKILEIYDNKEAPLVYATVINESTKQKTTTGTWGDYTLECNQGDTIKVIYIGYETLKWIVDDTKEQKDFYLKMIENPLDYIQP